MLNQRSQASFARRRSALAKPPRLATERPKSKPRLATERKSKTRLAAEHKPTAIRDRRAASVAVVPLEITPGPVFATEPLPPTPSPAQCDDLLNVTELPHVSRA